MYTYGHVLCGHQLHRNREDLESYRSSLVIDMKVVLDCTIPDLELRVEAARRQAVDALALARLAPSVQGEAVTLAHILPLLPMSGC